MKRRFPAAAVVVVLNISGGAAWASEPLFDTGRRLQEQKRYPEAEQAYRAALKEQPGSVPVLTNLGIVLARQGNTAEAIRMYRRALAIDKSAFPVQMNLAIAYYQTGDFDRAAMWLRQIVRKNPGDRRAIQLLAISDFQTRHFTEAAKLYDSLLPSDDVSVLIGAASSYLESGRKQEAERILDQVLAQGSGSPEVHSLLGLAQFGREDYAAAAKSFSRMIQLAPGRPEGHFYLGAVYFKQRELEQALAEWRKTLEADANYFPALLAAGALLADRGEYDAAGTLLARAAAARPGHAGSRYELGHVLFEQRDYRRALQELLAARRLDPESKQTRYLLARTYASLGRKAEAAVEFRRARELYDKGTADLLDRVLVNPSGVAQGDSP